jgi:ferredoxin
MMTHDEFVEKECRFCGSQRCYGVEFCNKYKVNVFGEKDDYEPYTSKYADLGFGENWVSESPEMPDEDRELAEAAQEAHDNLVRSLVEAGGEIRELRELLSRAYQQILLLGYDSGFTNQEIADLTNDIQEYFKGV